MTPREAIPREPSENPDHNGLPKQAHASAIPTAIESDPTLRPGGTMPDAANCQAKNAPDRMQTLPKRAHRDISGR